MQNLVLIGAGGHAREILDIVEAVNRVAPGYEVLGYLVDAAYGAPGTLVNDRPILGALDWLAGRAEVQAVCAVGEPALRRKLALRAEHLGASFCTVVHPRTTLTARVQLGDGVVIAAGALLTNNIRLGNHVHVNLGGTISHDAVLADFVYVAPGAHIAGGVVAEEGCYIGMGATIVERRRIGAWSIVGAGSTVIRDVPPDSTVVGVPAKVVKVRESGWHLR